MSKFNVLMLANINRDGEVIREVEIPDTDVKRCKDNTDTLLDLIFYYGQNDKQVVEGICSVSTGDVAEINDTYYLCMMIGWQEISKKQLEEYKQIDRRDRWFACCDETTVRQNLGVK